MRFIQSAGTTIIFRGITLAFSLAVSIVVSRALGPDGRGVYGLVTTFLAIASGFGLFGFATANTYLVARDRDCSRAVGYQSLGIGVVGAAVCAGVLMSLLAVEPGAFSGISRPLLVITLFLVPVYLWGHLFSRSYLGLSRIVSYNLFEAGARVLSLAAALLVLVVMEQSLSTFFGVFLASISIFIVAYVFHYFRVATTDNRVTAAKLIGPSFSYGARSWVATVLTWFTIRSGIFFVNHFLGTAEAGLFSVAQQLSELLIIIPSLLGPLVTARIAGESATNLTPRVVRTLTVVLLPAAVGMAVLANPLIVLLFGQEFLASADVLLIILPGALLLGLEVIMAGDIAGRGYPWRAALMWIPVCALNVLGYLVLIPRYGINGAALSTTLAYIAAFVYLTVYLRKLAGFTYMEMFIPTRDDLKTFLTSPRLLLDGLRKGASPEDSPGPL